MSCNSGTTPAIIIAPIGQQGPPGPQGPAGGQTGVGRVIQASGPVTMVTNDGIVEIAQTIPAACTVNLPLEPLNFAEYTVKDGAGNCQTYPITLIPQGGSNIDGQSSFVMRSNWQSTAFYYNGSNWRLV